MAQNNNYKKNNNKDQKQKKPYIPRNTVKATSKYTCEYKMPAGIAAEILKENKTGDVQKILCDYVNTYCGLLWECTKVIVE